MKKLEVVVISLGIILSLNVYPERIYAQELADACVQAKMDAQADVNETMWFVIGCLLGFPIGWPILPMVIEPSPPATRLIGKSPEYVATYTQCFKEEGKRIQQNQALMGCIIGSVIVVGGYLILWMAALETATPY